MTLSSPPASKPKPCGNSRTVTAALTGRGYLAIGGQIIDANVVPAPKQRNTEDDKTALKKGHIPERWKDKPAKLGRRIVMRVGASSTPRPR
jgi:hypothetical protein